MLGPRALHECRFDGNICYILVFLGCSKLPCIRIFCEQRTCGCFYSSTERQGLSTKCRCIPSGGNVTLTVQALVTSAWITKESLMSWSRMEWLHTKGSEFMLLLTALRNTTLRSQESNGVAFTGSRSRTP